MHNRLGRLEAVQQKYMIAGSQSAFEELFSLLALDEQWRDPKLFFSSCGVEVYDGEGWLVSDLNLVQHLPGLRLAVPQMTKA